mgnify:CR=1 FL=1
MAIRTISIYVDDGRIFEYDVEALTEEGVCAKVREHIRTIYRDGFYRHNEGGEGEYEMIPLKLGYAGSKVIKIKSSNILTKYPDRIKVT